MGDPTINVILFGEAGVGKSAVVNLIAQHEVARVSADVDGCTLLSTPYDIPMDGIHFRIFDTVGLNQPDFVLTSHLEAIERAYQLIVALRDAGGIHLLLLCMRASRMTLTTRNNYRLFSEFLCQKKVPVAVVVTGCEREEGEMEGWWTRNKTGIEQHGVQSDGHACVTAVTDGTAGEDAMYRESQRKIRELLKSCSLKSGAFTLDAMTWLAMTGGGMRSLIKEGKSPKKRDIEKVLSERLRLRRDDVKRIIVMMEKAETGRGNGEH